jgi:hypothetical protein
VSSDEELAAFVAARLDETEAAAKAFAVPEWMICENSGEFDYTVAPVQTALNGDAIADIWREDAAAWIARHDPAHMLREVAAKRQRLALYLAARDALAAALRGMPALGNPAAAHSYVRERINVNQAQGRFAAFEMSVRLDAMTWRDHPDCRPEWAPATG